MLNLILKALINWQSGLWLVNNLWKKLTLHSNIEFHYQVFSNFLLKYAHNKQIACRKMHKGKKWKWLKSKIKVILLYNYYLCSAEISELNINDPSSSFLWLFSLHLNELQTRADLACWFLSSSTVSTSSASVPQGPGLGPIPMSQFGTISRQISRHNSSTTSSASMVSATGTYRRAPSVSSQQTHINGGPAYTQNSGLIHDLSEYVTRMNKNFYMY